MTALTERKLLEQVQEILRLDRVNFPGEPWSRTEFLAHYQKKWVLSRLCVAESARRREIAGYLIAYLYGRHYVHISRLAVKKRYRGSGLSQRLVHTLERIAKRIGATTITVEVDAKAVPSPEAYEMARRFYSNLGFGRISDQQLTGYLKRKNKLQLSAQYLFDQPRNTVFRLKIQQQGRRQVKNRKSSDRPKTEKQPQEDKRPP